MKLVINVLAFQSTWFACVWGAANGMSWLGPAIAVLAIALHLVLTPTGGHRREIAHILAAAVLGFALETAMLQAGLVRYADTPAGVDVAPAWLVAMWAAFGTLINRSLAFLQSRLWLAALLGALAGPLAYLAGERLGAMTMTDPMAAAMIAIAIMWLLALPALMMLSRRRNLR